MRGGRSGISKRDWVTRDRVTLEVSFTKYPFRPDIAMRDVPFEVTAPGDRTPAEAARPVDGHASYTTLAFEAD